MELAFDYLTDTLVHQREVGAWLELIAGELRRRAFLHDNSKLLEPEFSIFVSTREDFKKVNYGTPEYNDLVQRAKPAVDHHYSNNRHHTAYWQNGINDMTLMDVIEMVCDWLSAEKRSPDKTLEDTLDFAFKKYKIDHQLQMIIRNTIRKLKEQGGR